MGKRQNTHIFPQKLITSAGLKIEEWDNQMTAGSNPIACPWDITLGTETGLMILFRETIHIFYSANAGKENSMKNSKKLIALLMAAVMAMAMSLTAFGATTVKMYGYMNGAYAESSHTSAFIGDVVDEGDGAYTITFVKATVYGREGYISSMTVNGNTFDADEDGTMEVYIEYNPTVEVADGVYGQPIEYSISMAGTSGHPNSTGALVIK